MDLAHFVPSKLREWDSRQFNRWLKDRTPRGVEAVTIFEWSETALALGWTTAVLAGRTAVATDLKEIALGVAVRAPRVQQPVVHAPSRRRPRRIDDPNTAPDVDAIGYSHDVEGEPLLELAERHHLAIQSDVRNDNVRRSRTAENYLADYRLKQHNAGAYPWAWAPKGKLSPEWFRDERLGRAFAIWNHTQLAASIIKWNVETLEQAVSAATVCLGSRNGTD